MKTSVVKRGNRWVVLLGDTPESNWGTKEEATTRADWLSKKKPVGKMSWADFKKSEGIDSNIFE